MVPTLIRTNDLHELEGKLLDIGKRYYQILQKTLFISDYM